MQKTKLGISVGLLGALIYFTGLINSLALIVMVGYVLLKEENPWLRKSAVKAVLIVFSFTILSVVISSGNEVFTILNTVIGWFRDSSDYSQFRFKYPFGLDTIVRCVLYIIESLILIVLGIKAFKQGSIKIGLFDDTVNKHMDE
jgi:uncharacterized membrane protein